MSDPQLTARAFLEAYDFIEPVAADVIMVFDESLVPKRRGRGGRRRHPFRAAAELEPGIDIVASGQGGPVAVVTLELLAALGARRVITVGTAAALNDTPTGSVLVVERASRDGAPLRYPSDATTADAALVTALLNGQHEHAIASRSTDQPFRMTAEVLAAARTSAQIVEMECAAMFQAAPTIGLAVASLVAISDHYDDHGWRPGPAGAVAGALRDAVDRGRQAFGGEDGK